MDGVGGRWWCCQHIEQHAEQTGEYGSSCYHKGDSPELAVDPGVQVAGLSRGPRSSMAAASRGEERGGKGA